MSMEMPNRAAAVTSSDTDDLPGGAAWIYVGVTGNVAIVPANAPDNTAVTFVGVPAGNVVPCLARRVMSTNTTATSLVANYIEQ